MISAENYPFVMMFWCALFRNVQEVHLDKHIKLLDSPGVVMAAKSTDSASLVLRNCVKVCMYMGVLGLCVCYDAAIGCRWSLLPTP